MILRDKDRDRICKIAGNCFTVAVEIWAYGSRVNGDCHEGSDLDLVIVNPDDGVRINEMYYDFVAQLRDSNIPILVDVKMWSAIPESFRRNILLKYEVLCKVN